MPLPPGAIPLRPDPQALHDRNVTAVVRAAIVNARVVSDPGFSAADLLKKSWPLERCPLNAGGGVAL